MKHIEIRDLPQFCIKLKKIHILLKTTKSKKQLFAINHFFQSAEQQISFEVQWFWTSILYGNLTVQHLNNKVGKIGLWSTIKRLPYKILSIIGFVSDNNTGMAKYPSTIYMRQIYDM